MIRHVHSQGHDPVHRIAVRCGQCCNLSQASASGDLSSTQSARRKGGDPAWLDVSHHRGGTAELRRLSPLDVVRWPLLFAQAAC